MCTKTKTLNLIIIFLIVSNCSDADSYADSNCGSSGPVAPTNPLVSFLQRVQEAALKFFGPAGFDPKAYIDMSLKHDLSTTVAAFDRSGSKSKEGLTLFLNDYLSAAGKDLVYVVPEDFRDRPDGFLPNVTDPIARKWAFEVHGLWKNLSRKVSDRVLKNPEFYTLLPLENPVIIPGSRFKEVYYWDSYWVIRGLLVSKMYDTAKGIIYNLISLIDIYGYVLNGARAYYTMMSQPPLLSSMVIDVYNQTGDLELVRKALPALEKEYVFWTSEEHAVIVQDSNGLNHSLSRYYAKWNQSRPESSTIDKATVSKLSSKCSKAQLYREIASAAESGWDLSTRWMRKGSDLTTLATTSILPVDLNAFILKMELDITTLAIAIRKTATAKQYKKASKARTTAIHSIFWNQKKGCWLDYWLKHSDLSGGVYKWNSGGQNPKMFASNFIPLWIPSLHSDVKIVDKVVKSLLRSTLIHEAGIATSLTDSGHPWDFPNGWAPLQHMIVEGLSRSGSLKIKQVAQYIAVSWIRTNYVTYIRTGAMDEKYDVQKCGGSVGGSEYTTQTGFGWSNGVVLAFLEEFGWPKDLKIDCS